MKWTKKGFEEFRKGSFGNGGQNLYVSAKGTLQRIRNFDVNGDGYFDLPLANSHSMNERPEIHIYDEIGQKEPLKLPSNGSFTGIFADITGDGTEDLIVACQHNGVHTDTSAVIYYASDKGLSEKYNCELRVPNSLAVAAGDFNGTGKQSLAFSSEKNIRVFYNGELGIEPSIFDTLEIEAISMAAGDLDGDGYDDLYVMHGGDAHLTVYWGGEDGINPERKTDFGTTVDMTEFCVSSTTPGRKLARWILWHTEILDFKGKKVTFRVEKDNTVVFESFGKDRQPIEEFRFEAFDPQKITHYRNPYSWNGVMDVCIGDLKNDGNRDIVVAITTSRDDDKTDDLLILWGDENYSLDAATRIPVRASKSLFIGAVGDDEKNYLFVNQASTPNDLEIEIPVFSFAKDKSYEIVRNLPVLEPGAIITGKSRTDGKRQIAVINHEGETKMGFEDVAVFLGGPDGFSNDRQILLPGCAAVDMIFADMTDNGYPDILVSNCAENAPELDPGNMLYFNSEKGFDKDNKLPLNTYVGHGMVIGDFRHSGYLDIIWTGLADRTLHIIEGGPKGLDIENQKEIVLGPNPENAKKFRLTVQDEYSGPTPPDESENRRQFGGMRNPICADFNGDGWLDLLLPNLYGDHTFIMWGGPDGFSPDNMQTLATDGVVTANAADLDGDGYLDLVLGGFTGVKKSQVKESYTTIYWGSEKGFSENRKCQLQSFCTNDLTINDFNNDGFLDIYSTSYYGIRTRDAESYLYFGSEDGIFHRGNLMRVHNNSGTGALSGDFNGDGYIDLAIASHKAHGNHVCDSFVYWGTPDGLDLQNPTRLRGRGPHGMSTIDPGNIMDRSDGEYYTSEAFDAKDKKATKVSWCAENGKRTWVKIQFRCADSKEALENAEWSESFENNADISALNLSGYVQYKLELGAPCGAGTPRVTEVTVDFE